MPADLVALWEAHCRHEFETRDVDATMATMVQRPHVNHVPTMTGGVGHDQLKRFYKYHFIGGNPPDTELKPISRTVGADQIVDELIFCFTHTSEIDWMLPGIAPTGKRVEVPLVAIVRFEGDKVAHEHIYWDQASVLVQVGLLDPKALPVAGIDTARKVAGQRAAQQRADDPLGRERGQANLAATLVCTRDCNRGRPARLSCHVRWLRHRAGRCRRHHDLRAPQGRWPAAAAVARLSRDARDVASRGARAGPAVHRRLRRPARLRQAAASPPRRPIMRPMPRAPWPSTWCG